jgi:hypothetical protein
MSSQNHKIARNIVKCMEFLSSGEFIKWKFSQFLKAYLVIFGFHNSAHLWACHSKGRFHFLIHTLTLEHFSTIRSSFLNIKLDKTDQKMRWYKLITLYAQRKAASRSLERKLHATFWLRYWCSMYWHY